MLPYVAPITLLLCTALSGDFLQQLLGRLTISRARIVFIGGFFFVTTASVAGLRSTNVQDELAKGYSIPSSVLAQIQKPFDRDGDGFSPNFGGGDCDDTDPLIHPDATEIYGNDIDENCDGRSLAQQVTQKTSLPKIVNLPSQDKPLNIVLITVYQKSICKVFSLAHLSIVNI